jgi:hypothetical protein
METEFRLPILLSSAFAVFKLVKIAYKAHSLRSDSL